MSFKALADKQRRLGAEHAQRGSLMVAMGRGVRHAATQLQDLASQELEHVDCLAREQLRDQIPGDLDPELLDQYAKRLTAQLSERLAERVTQIAEQLQRDGVMALGRAAAAAEHAADLDAEAEAAALAEEKPAAEASSSA